MAIASWQLVRVYGTWVDADGARLGGNYTVRINARLTNSADDLILPAGVFKTGALSTSAGVASLDVMVPSTDDVDIEQSGWTVEVDVVFTDTSRLPETYQIAVPYANRPTVNGGTGVGVNLRTIALADRTTGAATYVATPPPGAVVMAGGGIDPTGVTDSTSALQAKLDGSPLGSTLLFPPGVFKFSTLDVTGGRRLRGSGWRWLRDGVDLFADTDWQRSDLFHGTVLRSTATTGTAISLNLAGTTSAHAQDFLLIGPGSGSSAGIALGAAAGANVNGSIDNVAVANFTTGLTVVNANECRVSLAARGCVTGVTLGTDATNNTFDLLDTQRCVTGLEILDNSCMANVFTGFIAQANTGTGAVIRGDMNTFIAPYFELNTNYQFDIVSGKYNTILDPCSQGSGTQHYRLGAASTQCKVIGLRGLAGNFEGENMGTGNLFIGQTAALVDTGSNTILIDLNGEGLKVGKIQGPVTLLGNVRVPAGPVASRPSAAGLAYGTLYYNATTARPNWADGSGSWRDSAGTVVA